MIRFPALPAESTDSRRGFPFQTHFVAKTTAEEEGVEIEECFLDDVRAPVGGLERVETLEAIAGGALKGG